MVWYLQPNIDDMQVKRTNICIAKLDLSWNTIAPHVILTRVLSNKSQLTGCAQQN